MKADPIDWIHSTEAGQLDQQVRVAYGTVYEYTNTTTTDDSSLTLRTRVETRNSHAAAGCYLENNLSLASWRASVVSSLMLAN
jgi:hypothetical protein